MKLLLISKDELVSIVKSGLVYIPIKRLIATTSGDIAAFKHKIKDTLVELCINDSNDYAIALVNSKFDSNGPLTYFDIEKIYSLDKKAHGFFNQFNPQFNCEFSDFNTDELLQKSSQLRLNKILKEEFQIEINGDLQKEFDLIAKNEKIKCLLGFKREARLKENQLSYINDIITIAMIAKPDTGGQIDENEYGCKKLEEKAAVYAYYKKGDNIAQKYYDDRISEHSELKGKEDADITVIIDLLPKIERERQQKEPGHISANLTILQYIYLQLAAIKRKSPDEFVFEKVLELFNKVKDSCKKNEAHFACKLFFEEMEYSDIYKSYYIFCEKRAAKEKEDAARNQESFLEQKVIELIGQNDSLKEQNGSLKEQIEGLRELVERSVEQNDALKKEFHDSLQSLCGKVDSLEKESKNTSSLLQKEGVEGIIGKPSLQKTETPVKQAAKATKSKTSSVGKDHGTRPAGEDLFDANSSQASQSKAPATQNSDP